MLKAVLSKLEFEALDGTVQAFYAEKDGKYYLTVQTAEGYALEDITGLKSTLQKERKAKEDAEKKVKKFETDFDGITDPGAARDALSRVDELANFDPDKKLSAAKDEFQKQITTKFEGERKKLESDFASQMEELKMKNGVYKTQLQGALITNAAQAALVSAGAKGDGRLLLPHVEANVRMVEKEDGKFDVEIVNHEDGTARLTPKGGSTAKMTIPELVEEMKTNDEYAHGFKGTEAQGGGASPSDSGGTVSGGKVVLTKEQSRDVRTYRAAKERAAKENKQLIILD